MYGSLRDVHAAVTGAAQVMGTRYKLPPRDRLWTIVQEAYDCLYKWVYQPDSRSHPAVGVIHFDAWRWGSVDGVDGRTPGEFRACYAGLWYLHKEGRPLGDEYPIPATADFLNRIRYPNIQGEYIEELLGVPQPPQRGQLDDLVGGGWDPNNPLHILSFLEWLLTQHQLQRKLQTQRSIDMEVVVND